MRPWHRDAVSPRLLQMRTVPGRYVPERQRLHAVHASHHRSACWMQHLHPLPSLLPDHRPQPDGVCAMHQHIPPSKRRLQSDPRRWLPAAVRPQHLRENDGRCIYPWRLRLVLVVASRGGRLPRRNRLHHTAPMHQRPVHVWRGVPHLRTQRDGMRVGVSAWLPFASISLQTMHSDGRDAALQCERSRLGVQRQQPMSIGMQAAALLLHDWRLLAVCGPVPHQRCRGGHKPPLLPSSLLQRQLSSPPLDHRPLWQQRHRSK